MILDDKNPREAEGLTSQQESQEYSPALDELRDLFLEFVIFPKENPLGWIVE